MNTANCWNDATAYDFEAITNALNRKGLRYPIPNHGIEKSPLDSVATSYGRT